MLCPECQVTGKKSRVFPHGSSSTLLHCEPYYDEDGKLHDHDLNTTTTLYSCSEGHEWAEKHRSSCWCGWKG